VAARSLERLRATRYLLLVVSYRTSRGKGSRDPADDARARQRDHAGSGRRRQRDLRAPQGELAAGRSPRRAGGSDHGAGAGYSTPGMGPGPQLRVACEAGLEPLGFDLNPAMVVIAKARVLDTNVRGSLRILGTRIAQRARANSGVVVPADNPLTSWFAPSGATAVRALERAIRYYLVGSVGIYESMTRAEELSSLAAFYYVALFRAARRLLKPFQTTNPTWLRVPDKRARISPTADTVTAAFAFDVRSMAYSMGAKDAPRLFLVQLAPWFPQAIHERSR
jgi:hypothetical protein